jgi:hypothetical protein
VVGLHVVDNKVVNLAVANDLLDMFDVLGEEIDLYGIYQTHLLVVDEVGVVRNTIGQRPQTFE